jgi:chitin synthase
LFSFAGDELRRTLHGIAGNLPMLSKMGLHWSEICVAIFIDGREFMSKSMSDYLQFEMKLYDPTILRSLHKGRPVVLHVFERSVELPKHTSYREYHYPLQCMLGLKERNGGKLNSHLWFFSGFCVQINPKYTVLFDVGTVPQEDALLRMYAAMEDDPQVGGSCGEIAVRNPKPWNILDASQAFEYKISHVLDKAAESVCGYITVLPGAFSMYRWVAIRGEPLCAYFTIEEIPLTELGPAVSNMYLAEDR